MGTPIFMVNSKNKTIDIRGTLNSRNIFNNKGILRVPLMSIVLFLLLTINIGVPPTLTFFRELLMITTLIGKLEFVAMLSITIFFLRALYNLLLYVSLRQSKETRNKIVSFLI